MITSSTTDYLSTVLALLGLITFGSAQAQNSAPQVDGASTVSSPESGTTNSSNDSSGGAVNALTITFKNGTKGHDSVRDLGFGIVVDRQHLRSATSSGKQSSLRQMIAKHGHQFSVKDGRASVDLSSTSISKPVVIIAYKKGIYLKSFTGSERMNVTMTVYESTSSKDVLRVRGHHIPMQYRDGKLVVNEIITMENTGDRTYADPERTRSFATEVPENAENVRTSATPARMASSSSETAFEQRFSVMTLSPGQTVQKRIRYELPVQNGSVTFRRSIRYPTDSFFIAVPRNTVRDVQTDLTVQRNATSPSGRGKVVKITGSNLSPGRTISVDLQMTGSTAGTAASETAPTGTGSTSRSTSPSNMTLYLVGIGVLAGFSIMISLSTLVYVYRTTREKKPMPSPAAPPSEPDDAAEMRDFLLEEIARLDNDLDDGNISEDYHRERRSRLKSRLLDLEGADS